MARPRTTKPISEAELRRLIGEGKTWEQIADESGHSKMSLKVTAYVLGLRWPRARRPNADAES
jgi:hypothetical protein